GKSWSLENERDDDEEDLQNVVIPQFSLGYKTLTSSQADNQQETIKHVAQPTALIKYVEHDEEDPLDKYMESIEKEIKSFHENNTKVITTITQAQLANNSNGSIIKIITKTVKNESIKPSDTVPTTNDHHNNSSIVEIQSMDTDDSVSSLVTICNDVAKHAKEKGPIMEQDIYGLEYSSEEEDTKRNEDLDDDISSMGSKKSKLDIMITNHDKIYYQPFQVAAYRKELDNIKIVGKQCPRPIKTWSQCLTSDKILQTLKKHKYEKPTPIQAQALPIILSAIIITPTRELALQTTKECKKFAKLFNIRCVAVYGGTNISNQIAQLKRGAEIIVCTPGRLVDMLTANNGRITNLRRVTYVVVDEADRMFDMGFEPQIRMSISLFQVTKILDSIHPDRQIVMFSATFPKKLEVLACKYLDKPIEVTVGGRSIVCKDIIQNVIILADDEEKYLKLLELLGLYQSQGLILVFVDTQEHCDELMKKLMNNHYPCMSLHGGIDQSDRHSIIIDFKNGDIPLIIATSVAVRGLDIKDLILVVNYDCPNHYEDYVHRCGRTGRAGNIGYAYTFLTPAQERYAGNIIEALKTSGAYIPEELILLWNDYVKKNEDMGIKIKVRVGGFHGRSNYETNSLETQSKNMQAAAMGLVDLDDDEESQIIDQQIQCLFNKSKKSIKIKCNVPINQNEEISDSTITNDVASKLELAMKRAARLTLNKSETRDSIQGPTTSLFQHVNTLNSAVSSYIVAYQRASELNRKLNYQKSKEEIQVTENASKIFEEELEINDFPQNVRSKIIRKKTLAHICECADVDIFVRGQYYSNNQVVQNDKKFYLQIQSLTEHSLQLAKEEVTRLIKEEMMKMQKSALQLVNRGRYKV
ncbi:unnamed protein product, partial [Rotaria sp. Silwood1]